ncbi:hypothetical protein CBER1_11664 [Cercospora berteroae]|uniref:Uncharacterized protein n=1 Tax=Cercospora berteroae TaxID=357750 RepID=A0A2S6BZM5_9PEZI|nr:hypothetical protein CBER1_11664 [Cercospora berteroae]
MPGSKKVHVSGVHEEDVASLIGCLVYKLGLDMPSLEALEKAGSHAYADIPRYLANKNLQPSFYTKQNLCEVIGKYLSFHLFSGRTYLPTDNPQIADTILLLVGITSPEQEVIKFLQSWVSRAESCHNTKLVVLVGKMEQIHWSASKYDQLLSTIESHLQHERLVDVLFIPISIADGNNLLENSEKLISFRRRIGPGAQDAGPQSLVDAIDA